MPAVVSLSSVSLFFVNNVYLEEFLEDLQFVFFKYRILLLDLSTRN
jgi:hypothetical protein